MKRIFLFVVFFLSLGGYAQVKIGDNPTVLKPGALLELESTNKALLIPRVTGPSVITTPVNGMMIYDTTLNCFRGYQNNAWSGCNFVNTNPSTNGSGVISAITSTCPGTANNSGKLMTETESSLPETLAKQTITVTATTVGDYDITATSTENPDVKFRAVGQLVLGSNTIVLAATGIPVVGGTHTYTLNINPASGCKTFTFFTTYLPYNAICNTAGAGTAVVEVTSPTGRIWMDRELGASRAATAINDYKAFGCLYQWGRGNDGHASIKWTGALEAIAAVNAATTGMTNTPGALWVATSGGDWRTTVDNTLWQSPGLTNNPCPQGFRVPTLDEFEAEKTALAITDLTTAYNSILKVPGHQMRNSIGSFNTLHNSTAIFWTTNIYPSDNGYARTYTFSNTATTGFSLSAKAQGNPIRCIKEYTSPISGGSAQISTPACNGGSSGTLYANTPASNVKKTVSVYVTSPGTYSITTDTKNGVTYKAAGTFTPAQAYTTQNVEMTAEGSSTVVGNNTYTFTLGSQNCTFVTTTVNSTTSNGSAVIDNLVSTSSAGTMTKGTAVSGVTQTLTATVSQAGSYSLSTAAVNGVTFSKTGNLTVGTNTIVLEASGTPTAGGAAVEFKVNNNGTSGLTFNRAILSGTSGTNTTAEMTITSANMASSGTLTYDSPIPTGTSQTISVNVTAAGSYALTTTVNGITYAKSAAFIPVGNAQTIVLEASGTVELPPVTTTSATYTFVLNSTSSNNSFTKTIDFPQYIASCAASDVTTVVDLPSSTTGKLWMDRNLGASRAATATNDYKAFGCVFQWGRGKDGHASIRWSGPDNIASGVGVNGTGTGSFPTDTPNSASFTANSTSPWDWRVPQNNNLWQGVSGINNPCPTGYRLPTNAEYTAEFAARGITNMATAFAQMKIPGGGGRLDNGAFFIGAGTGANLWTSTVDSISGGRMAIGATTAVLSSYQRGGGFSVRCIKN